MTKEDIQFKVDSFMMIAEKFQTDHGDEFDKIEFEIKNVPVAVIEQMAEASDRKLDLRDADEGLKRFILYLAFYLEGLRVWIYSEPFEVETKIITKK